MLTLKTRRFLWAGLLASSAKKLKLPQENLLDRTENNFDFIRLVLALFVILSHSYPLGGSGEANEPIYRLTHGQSTLGAIAVNLFFVVSGFLVTASFDRSSSIWSYFRKRVFRIYPGFVVLMAFSAILIVPAAGAYLVGGSLATILASFAVRIARLLEFRYQNAFATNPYPLAMNGSVWSIPYEFWCYILVALLGTSRLLHKRRLILSLFLSSIVLSFLFTASFVKLGNFALEPRIHNALYAVFGDFVLWARLLPLYLAGVVVYLYRSRFRLSILWASASLLSLTLGSWIPGAWVVIFPFAATYLVLFVAYHPSIRLHHWARFGDFSYGTYLYAFPVMQLIMRWIGHPVRPFILFLLATPSTLVLAVLSWHGIEKRFLPRHRRSRHIQQREPSLHLKSQA